MRKRPRILKNYIRKEGRPKRRRPKGGLRGRPRRGREIYRKGMTNGGSK